MALNSWLQRLNEMKFQPPDEVYTVSCWGNTSKVKGIPARLGACVDRFAAEQIKNLLLRFSLGWNVGITRNSSPTKKKTLSKEALASSRTKRMMTKIRKKYGFFCEEFIQRELESKPSYYQGYQAYYFDEMEDYCERIEKLLTPPEVLGRLVTLGIPPENKELKAMEARRAQMMKEARERLLSPEYKAKMEERTKANREAEKARKLAEYQWLMRPDRDENSLFANPIPVAKEDTHETNETRETQISACARIHALQA